MDRWNPSPVAPKPRIAIVGDSGSGKTTLARRLAGRLEVPHVELDAIHWGPGWTPSPEATFRRRVAEALGGEAWVTDGGYSAVRDIVWGRADTLVWLDYALPVTIWRLTRRTLRRVATGEALWNGNRETLRGCFFSRDSLFLWLLKTHGKRRRQYPLVLRQPEYAHLRVFRHRSPRETERWLEWE
jgi:adenylate kinase family enzyme